MAGSLGRPTWCSRVRRTRWPPTAAISSATSSFRSRLTSPQWVESIELRPTNPRATHHARLGVDRSLESVRRDAADPLPGYEGMAWGQDPDGQLVTWVPGMVAHRGAPGSAWRLYPKTCLVLHTHMQPTGKAGDGAVSHRHPLRQAVAHAAAGHVANRQPRHRYSRRAIRITWRPTSTSCRSISTCIRSFRTPIRFAAKCACEAELPDGSTKSLIWIKDFDEKWHDNYRYRRAGAAAARNAAPVRLSPTTTRTKTFAIGTIRRPASFTARTWSTRWRTFICR